MPTERTDPKVVAERARFIARLSDIDPKRLVFIDESGSHIAMAREYARAPRGERVADVVPRNRGSATTMLGAVALDGMRALMTVEGGTTKPVFLEFVRDHLVPHLRSGDVVVMDNLGAHHAVGVRQEIEAAGAIVIYMPAYSPDLNPIEELWSKLKAVLKGFGARTRDALVSAIFFARDLITRSDIRGWFGHSGYVSQAP